jgi:transcriptional regulator with XRE-family HTH domain
MTAHRTTLGQEIRRLRAGSGLTPAELSARTGIREAFLTAIENDREEPSAAALQRIARELEAAGGSYGYLAGLLTGPELDPSGEYATREMPRVEPPPTPAPAPLDDAELQFDRAVHASAPVDGGIAAPKCEACGESIEREYHTVNGRVVCARCRRAAEWAAETPSGIRPLLVAGAYGFGAAVAGAIIYYAVIAIANLQIGIVAILIGYMVGYSVRKGARGRGGIRFQILAVALTYVSIAFAYTPIAITASINARKTATAGRQPIAARAPGATPSKPGLLLALGALSFLVAALPVLVVVGSLPFGLISAFIIYLGMRQAWRMTAAPLVQVFGPYQVGAAAVAGSA